MPKIKINKDKCKGCGLCVMYCPKSLIEVDSSLNKKGIHPVKFMYNEKCTGCSFCAIMCPDLAITVYR